MIKRILPKSKAPIYFLRSQILQDKKLEEYNGKLGELQQKNSEDLKTYKKKSEKKSKMMIKKMESS